MKEGIILRETIRSIQNAIQRARLAWIVMLIMGFVYFSAYYTQKFSANIDLLERRELLSTIIEKELQNATRTDITEELDLKDPSKIDFYIRSRENDSSDFPLRHLEDEMTNIIDRKWLLDTIEIPVIGVRFASNDLIIVGTLALIIVGFWMVANLSNERMALFRFIGADRDPSGQWTVDYTRSRFDEEDIVSAFESIANSLVFAPPRRYVLLDAFMLFTYAVPIVMTLVVLFLDGMDLFSKGLEYWLMEKWLVGILLFFVIAAIYGRCSYLPVSCIKNPYESRLPSWIQ